MKSTILLFLIVTLIAAWLPVSGQNPAAAATQPWPPDLTSLLKHPYGGGWSPEVRYVEPAGQLGGSTQFVHVQGTFCRPICKTPNWAQCGSPVRAIIVPARSTTRYSWM